MDIKKNDCMEIGKRIRYLRKDILHLTQEEFAKGARVSRSNLGNIETGTIGASQRVKDDICNSYGINIEWLENGSGGDENIFRNASPSEKAYNRFGYLIENGSPSKKAALTALLELMYVLPDDKWDMIIDIYSAALKEASNSKGENI